MKILSVIGVCRRRRTDKSAGILLFWIASQTLIGGFSGDVFVNVDEVRNAVISAFCGNLADRGVVTAE